MVGICRSGKEVKSEEEKMEEIGSAKELTVSESEEERDICKVGFKNKVHEYCEIFLMGLMIIMGLLTLTYTIYAHWLE